MRTFIKKILLAILMTTLVLILLYPDTIKSKVSRDELICDKCNLIWISIDTLRPDHMGIYDYTRNTTAYIDSFFKEGLVFMNAISATTWTLPSHMSIFTGTYPSTHGIKNKYLVPGNPSEDFPVASLENISPDIETISSILKTHGYRTAAFTGGSGVHHKFGFDKGFDVYTDDVDFGGFSKTIPEAISWLEENKDSPAFIFLHGYDVHGQYVPEEGYDFRYVENGYDGSLDGSKEEQIELREEGVKRGGIYLTNDDVNFLISLYDEKISRVDSQLRYFLDNLNELGMLDNTIIMLFSDHGEELMEHGRIDHGHSLYEELIRIPLLIHLPGVQDKQVYVKGQVSTIDIFPTTLEMLNIKIVDSVGDQFEGNSLIEHIVNNEGESDVFLETDYRYSVFLRGLRTQNRWKYIYDVENNTKEFFDLISDPKENRNIMGVGNEAEEKLETKLKEFLNK